MKGLRTQGDGGNATSHLGSLNLDRRTSTIIGQTRAITGQAGDAAAALKKGPTGVPRQGDGDLIDTADEKLQQTGTRTINAAGSGVKKAGKETVAVATKNVKNTAGHVKQAAETLRETASATASATRGGMPATRTVTTKAVKGGLTATTKRLTAQRAAKKAASKTLTRGAASTGKAGVAGARGAAQAASVAARIVAALVSAISSTPGLMVTIAVTAVAVAIMAVLSFLPSIGHQAEQASKLTATSVTIPAEYLEDVTRAGSICDEITPGLLGAQIQQESGWNPNAQSPVGAQGISQFMPSTWAGRGMDGDGDGKIDVWNAHDAIWSQGNFMCSLVDQVKAAQAAGTVSGDTASLALAAYNAGFGAVTKYGGIPPYAETQHYVEVIMAAATTTAIDHDETGVSANLTEAVEWAKGIAADDTYGYVWGGNGLAQGGYDCSGLTTAMYARLGITLPRTAATQQNVGTAVTRDELKVGDLIFWGSPAYHVAVYAGAGWMVSADNPLQGINFEPIYLNPSGYRRII